jgi:hypothetical protein
LVRAKFKVESVTEYAEQAIIAMTPVVSGSKENQEFYKYTPGGKLDLQVVSKETASVFIPGKEYYVDFTPVLDTV